MTGHVSPVQNSDTVLYCRLIRLKNVVAVKEGKQTKNIILDVNVSEPCLFVYILITGNLAYSMNINPHDVYIQNNAKQWCNQSEL